VDSQAPPTDRSTVSNQSSKYKQSKHNDSWITANDSQMQSIQKDHLKISEVEQDFQKIKEAFMVTS